MNNEISILGQNIKEIRKAKDISRNQLNRLTEIDNLILYEIESGDISTLNPIDLEKIAKALNVTVTTLLSENANYDCNLFN